MQEHHDHHHRHDHAHEDHTAPCCVPSNDVAAAAGFRADRAYKVRGLDCAEEVAVLRQAVGPLVGGTEKLAFDVLNGRMTISADASDVADEAIIKAIAGTGMSAIRWSRHAGKDEADIHRRQQVMFTAASGAFVLTGLVLHVILAGGLAQAWKLFGTHAGQPTPWPEILSYLAAALLGARFVLVKAWYAARNVRPDMHLLMTVAIMGAMIIGEWFEAATVSFLFALSLTLESWSVARARRAIAALLDLVPPTAHILRLDGSEAIVPVAEVKLGSRFVVLAGESIPLDGEVIEGSSAVNQAPITGESVPVEKQPGADVFAGTINGDGTLIIQATRIAEDTTLARIIHMVEEAHARRAPSEQWVERFARVYTPAVMTLAILIFLLPPIAFGQSWDDWFYRALVLLVIACPTPEVRRAHNGLVAGSSPAGPTSLRSQNGTLDGWLSP